MNPNECHQCKWYQKVDNDSGECHQKAPEPVIFEKVNNQAKKRYRVVWPEVDALGWCRDFFDVAGTKNR